MISKEKTSKEKELEAKEKKDEIFRTLSSIALKKDTHSFLGAVEDLLPELLDAEKELVAYLDEEEPSEDSSSKEAFNPDEYISREDLNAYIEKELKPVLENKKPCTIKKAFINELLSQLRYEIKRRETHYNFNKDYWRQIYRLRKKSQEEKLKGALRSAVRVRKPCSCYSRSLEAVLQKEWEIATFYLSRLLDLYEDFEPMIVSCQNFDIRVFYRGPKNLSIRGKSIESCLEYHLNAYNDKGIRTDKVEAYSGLDSSIVVVGGGGSKDLEDLKL